MPESNRIRHFWRRNHAIPVEQNVVSFIRDARLITTFASLRVPRIFSSLCSLLRQMTLQLTSFSLEGGSLTTTYPLEIPTNFV
jgi:hypothetical protein